jgi:predicted Na+-dependent transporter
MNSFMIFVHRYFGMLLLVFCLLGLLVPSFGAGTPVVVTVSLAFIIFFSYFQIDFSPESLLTDFRISIRFWLVRYVIVPVVVYFAFKWIDSFYARVMLLAFLLPAAVSSPSFTVIFGGKPGLSLKILVYSSFLAILTIPFLMTLLLGSTIEVSAGTMLLTLVYTILIPFILHFPLRKVRRIKEFTGKYNSLFTLAGLSMIFLAVTARNKAAILGQPLQIALFAAEALVLYCLLYVAGYYLFPGQPADVRKTFSISSGANNIGLGVTITALFFTGDMNIFFIVSQLAWVVILIPLRRVLARL